MPPNRSPFLSPLSPNGPLVCALPPIDTPIFCHSKTPNFWFVTQRPPISDFVTQKPIIWIISPKLWLVTITEARILGELRPTFYYTLTERPHNLWCVTERATFFLVAPVTERPLCLRFLVALVRPSDMWVPPGWSIYSTPLNFIPLWDWTWCHWVFCVRSRLVFVKDSILGNWPKYERRRREENRARSASAEGARVRRRRKASAASLSPLEAQEIPRRNQLTISGAKLLQRPHKLDKLQFLGLWHRLVRAVIGFTAKIDQNLPS